jgi:hypothetical protein
VCSRHPAEERPQFHPQPAGRMSEFHHTANLATITRMTSQGYSKRLILVEHVTIGSSQSFDIVRTKLDHIPIKGDFRGNGRCDSVLRKEIDDGAL